VTQAGFTIDLDRCTGCSACRLACELANPVSPGAHWRTVTTYNPSRWSGAPVLHLSLACNHCAAPSCLTACPAGAYSKDAATGAVVLTRESCIGCRYCTWVCPYEAPRYVATAGTVEKCTFCLDRQRRGEVPACATACPTGALGFTRELPEAPESSRPPGLPETGTLPALRVRGRRRAAAPPELSAGTDAAPPRALAPVTLWRGLAGEWPLLVFTMTATLLVAWLGAALAGAPAPPAPAFLVLGAAAMAVSALHLGRPLRAWRALAGLRRSWVSREVAAFACFYALGAAALLFGGVLGVIGALAVACGAATLVAVDMVYRIRGQTVAAVPHSAMATLTAALLGTTLGGAYGLATIIALVKVLLYQARRARGLGVRSWLVSAVRLVVGLLLPLAVLPQEGARLLPLACMLLGELLDRAELYAELELVTPARQAARDLAAAVTERASVQA
jgi:Fe-S-cluster-containing dehydrogenase component